MCCLVKFQRQKVLVFSCFLLCSFVLCFIFCVDFSMSRIFVFPLCSLSVLINSASSRVSSLCVEVLCYLFIFVLSWGNVYMCVALCSRFLIDRGADLSLVNNDGDLAIDIADSDEMEMLLQQEIESKGKCEASDKQLLYVTLNLSSSYEFVSLC